MIDVSKPCRRPIAGNPARPAVAEAACAVGAGTPAIKPAGIPASKSCPPLALKIASKKVSEREFRRGLAQHLVELLHTCDARGVLFEDVLGEAYGLFMRQVDPSASVRPGDRP